MPGKHHTNRRATWFTTIVFYAVLLIASHVYQLGVGSYVDSINGSKLDFATLETQGSSVRVHYDEWFASSIGPNQAAVLLLHGSPGNAGAFGELGPLVSNGRRVIAPDLPGYGLSDSAPDLSYASQARSMNEFLNVLGVERVHVVGWSSSGGVAIEMADQFPDRVATITLLAGIGAQETEESGSYFFEHLKYGVGYVGLGVIPELIPHFGYLGRFKNRTGWLKAFWDSDQRELTRIMPTITTPTLILQGRHDFLVMDWAAEQHHEMMPTSKLIMLDASHFLPFLQADETAGYLNAFFARHDEPGVEPETDYLNLAPRKDRSGFDALLHRLGEWTRTVPWWAQLIGVIVLIRYGTIFGFAITMILVSMHEIDFGVAILGMMLGRGWWLMRGAHAIDRPVTRWGWVRGIGFGLVGFVIGMIVSPLVLVLSESLGLVGFALGVAGLMGVLAGARLVVSWEGRRRIRGQYSRLIYHEYWVTGLVYLPMLWWGIKRMIARRWLIELTSVNPGYAYDAGIMCESKMDINRKLGDGNVDDQAILHCVLIEENADTQARIDRAIDSMTNDDQLGGYPVFAKPDQGERGRAVEMICSQAELIAYGRDNDEPFVIQQQHHGAMEVGVLWVRHVESITDPNYTGPSGFIYAITIKHFPAVVGDGKQTLRRLILGHDRYRAQSRMFFDRMGQLLDTVPDAGERVALGVAGNHAQGAMFTDGEELITDELSARIGEIVDRFADEHGRGFDIGRFDLRCDSLEKLALGEGFGIVELNGLTSEPSNLYDPKRSIRWSWAMLCGYWLHAERLGAARLESGTGEMVDRETWKKIRWALVRVMFT
jgi:pimeloyl-ACP methyl ester carboxylesterase